jgi:gp16 family phage-associated protein
MTKATHHHPLPYPQTPGSAHSWFRSHGVCVAHWARDLGLERQIVVDALRGKIKGHRGKAHRVAVALGIKPNPDSGKQSKA